MADLKELVAQERREYQRKWRAANKDKVRESNRRYWENRVKKARLKENAEVAAAE